MQVVADTSALVSLGVVLDRAPNPLEVVLDAHEVVIPERVLSEVEATARYDDPSGVAAGRVLDRRGQFAVQAVTLDEAFPLDDGENAAVRLANETGASQLLCDEFNRLALVHASLTTARLVTTPVLLVLLARAGTVPASTADSLLADIAEARSWDGNAYVSRARATLERESASSRG